MARIGSYQKDDFIVDADKWIGTDSNSSNATRNFSAAGVANYLNSSNKINSQVIQYIYQDYQVGDSRLPGSISFGTPQPSSSTLFSSITTFKISKSEKDRPQNVSPFFSNALVDNYVLITASSDVNQWSVFKWDSVVQDAIETDFYDIGLTLVDSQGSLIDGQDYLVSLLQVSILDEADKTFNFNQAAPATVWTITHNLNKNCSVTIRDTNGVSISGLVNYVSLNQVTVTFSAAIAGDAYCN